jgi:hypothetical protein
VVEARSCLLLLLLAGHGDALKAATAPLPEFFGVYLDNGKRLHELKPHPQWDTTIVLGSHELSNVEVVAVEEGDLHVLVYVGGATDLMEIPIHRLERVGQGIDPVTGSVKLLKNVWYAHPTGVVVRLAPVSERPGLLVRGKPSREIADGYWALELRGILFPFSVGKHPEQEAGCLERGSMGGYEPCLPTAPLSKPAHLRERRITPVDAEIAVWGFVRKLSGDLWGTAIMRSAVGLVALLAVYGVLYWLRLFITGSFFLEIAPFRVWRDAAPSYLGEGLAARVVDELQRLQLDIREHGKFRGSHESDLAFHKVSVLPPSAAQVTIEFKGISPEALNAFLRRSLGRHALITCDLLPNGSTLRLLGRSSRTGPWEVEAPNAYGTGVLCHALREFAVFAVVAVRPSSKKALANALAYKQWRAFKNHEDEEALRLARLGLVAMPDQPLQLYNCGVAYQKLGRLDEAIEAYNEAILRGGTTASALRNRATAYAQNGELDLAEKDFLSAQSLDPKDVRIAPALERIRAKRAESRTDDQPAEDGGANGTTDEPRVAPRSKNEGG